MKRGRTEKGRRIDGSRLVSFIPGIVFFALLFQLAPASAQVWRVQNSGTSNDLNKIFFVDSIHGWAVGGNGTILRTTDGGGQWLQLESGETTALYQSASFIDTLNGWVISKTNYVIKTTDGGKTWEKYLIPTSQIFYDIFFSDSNVGWMVGGSGVSGVIFRTEDGGNSWQRVRDSSRGGSFRSIDFRNRNVGWIVGFNGTDNFDSSRIIHTTDAGVTWEVQQCGVLGGLAAVSFYNSRLGWATGVFPFGSSEQVIKTLNGGIDWFFSGPSISIGGVYDSYSTVESTDSSFVLIGSKSGRSPNIFRSSDGGSVWSRDTVERATFVNSISCTDATHCWACGGSGRIWRYTPTLLGVDEERIAQEVEPKVSITVSQRRDVVEVMYNQHESLSITTDLHDVLGKKLVSKSSSMHGEGPQSCSFDVHGYPSGVYYILSAVGGRTYVNSITVAR